MYPAQFEYHTPGTIREALDLLGRAQGRRQAPGRRPQPPAGDEASPRPAQAPGRPPEGARASTAIKEEGGVLVIGAMTTHYADRDLAGRQVQVPGARLRSPARSAIRWCATSGTIGGSLAHADPGRGLPGRDHRAAAPRWSPRARRASGRSRPTTSSRACSRQRSRADEILTEVRVPVLRAKVGAAYQKFPHPASRFAVVGVAAVLTVDGGQGLESRASASPAPAPRRCAPRASRPRSPARRRRRIDPGGGGEGARGRRRAGRSPGLGGIQAASPQGVRQALHRGGRGLGEVTMV